MNSETAIAKRPVGAVTSNPPHQPRLKTSSAGSTPVVSESTTRSQKRKSETVPPASNDDSAQLVTGRKKAKKSESVDPSNPPQRPAPRPTSRVLKAQLAASGRKPTSLSVSGAALETPKEQAATRKRPAEGEVVDEGALMTPIPGPPSKKVKGSSNANANKPQALRHTGSFFHQNWK